MERIPMVVVAGPTATGKSDLAIYLAKKLDGEVIGADSMQIYDKLSVGTARVTEKETDGIPHHLMGFVDPKERFSVGQYLPLAEEKVREVHFRGKLPIFCGGTGLYFSSFLDGVQYGDISTDPAIRQKLNEEFDLLGGEVLWQRLKEADSAAAEKIHPNNRQRLVRALEMLALGSSITEQNESSKSDTPPYAPVCIALDMGEKSAYWERVALRIDKMLEKGLVEEAKWLFSYAPDATAAQAIAYKELLPFLKNEATLEECRERLCFATRQYAKRQRTWLRRDGRFSTAFIDSEKDPQSFFEKILKTVESRLVL